jgi:ubiquinone/menaquinone biosynthesis C-methylase UbiE
MLAAQPVSAVLKLLADSTRLRILALLEREELRVGELSQALGMGQSRVSNHLRLMRDAGLLEERHAGPSTYLQLARSGAGNEIAARLWTTLRDEVAAQPAHAADLRRLEAVIAERERTSADFFERAARDWDKIGGEFQTGQARQRAAAMLLPPGLVLADLGCGTGYLASSLAGLARKVICVDRSRAMLLRARERLERAATSAELEFRLGELDDLPLAAAEVDGLVAAMVLHHMARLEPSLREMLRVLRPGGTAVVLELAPHREEWMHEEHGDRHLGLERDAVRAAFERTGFTSVEVEPVDDRYQPALPLEAKPAQEPNQTKPAAREHARLELFLVRGRKARDVRS